MKYHQLWMKAADCAAASWGYTGGYYGTDKAAADDAANIKIYCTGASPDPSSTETRASKTASDKQALRPPKINLPRQSASCSDITGTGNSAPATTHCKVANRSLHAARVTRQKYGLYAQDQYKKAATSYRIAGDIAQADAALREAALSNEAFEAERKAAAKGQSDPQREILLRSAVNILNAAQDIASKPATCADLKEAAALYQRAARTFLDADEIQKADELLLRHDLLIDEVDQLEQKGRCHRIREARNPPTGAQSSRQPEMTRAQCDAGQAALDQMQKIADSIASMTTAGSARPQEAQSMDVEIESKKIELASQGCRKPGGPPPTLGACQVALNHWVMKDHVPEDKARERARAAGCP